MRTIIDVNITNQVRVAVIQDRNEYQVRVYGYQPDPRLALDYSVFGIYRSEPEALRSYVSLYKELNVRLATVA